MAISYGSIGFVRSNFGSRLNYIIIYVENNLGSDIICNEILLMISELYVTLNHSIISMRQFSLLIIKPHIIKAYNLYIKI